MKKIFLPVVVAIAAVFANSCGTNYSLVANHNLNTTQVQLSQRNFRVVDSLKGNESATYVLLIGGLKKRLYSEAYANMMREANLMNNARAVVNVFTEEHMGGFFPLYYRRNVIVTGYVIEFTE